ncbi:MAG: biotin/lipoyl-binding protein [Flavobacteriales bacterium]
MEILLLLIYSFFVWLIFFKFKLLPWTFTSKLVVFTIPVVGIATLILMLNIVAPSSSDVRVINYVVPIVPRVTGRVVEVPVEPNVPVKKGDVLLRIDPVPFELDVKAQEANVASLRAQLLTSRANASNITEQLTASMSRTQAVGAQLELARLRVQQFSELATAGAGNRFDLEQAQADVKRLEADVRNNRSSEDQLRQRLMAKTPEGEQDEVAATLAKLAQAEAMLGEAQWKLDQCTVYAPSNGRVVGLALRPGATASQMPMAPVMSFVEDEQWVVAVYAQNEVRKVEPGNEAEISLHTHPGRIIKCTVESVVWATAQGQLPIGGNLPNTGVRDIPEQRLAVRLMVQERDKHLFLAPGAAGHGAIFTNSGHMLHVVRKVMLRVGAKMDWFIFKLH